MRKLTVFNFVTLNGFYKGAHGDISWHKHHSGDEEADFAKQGAGSDSILLFGRTTYEMMAGYWPTPQALKENKEVAEGMNKSEKIVFSNTLKKADWKNTSIVTGDIVAEIKKRKQTGNKDMTILGSGSIVTRFAEAGLIDAYTFMVDPVVIGEGTSTFSNIKHPLDLKLVDSRAFKNGTMVLTYAPAK